MIRREIRRLPICHWVFKNFENLPFHCVVGFFRDAVLDLQKGVRFPALNMWKHSLFRKRHQRTSPFCTIAQEPQNAEQLKWLRFFDDPTLWWDNRARKWSNQPDFKHGLTGEGLWISPLHCPKWLEAKLKNLEDPNPAVRSSRAVYRRGYIQEQQSVNFNHHVQTFQGSFTETTEASVSLEKFQQDDIPTLLASLKEASTNGDLDRGRKIHDQAVQWGNHTNIYVSSALVNMYAKSGSMEEACEVFDGMQWHNAVSWNSLIMGYAENGDGELALELLERMHREGCAPNERTLVAALKACIALAEKEDGELVTGKLVKLVSLEKGRSIHSRFVINRWCELDLFVASTLVDLCSKCGNMAEAQIVFDKMPCHNVVSWTALLSGYAENGEGEMALSLFSEMQRKGCEPNSLTFVAALKACGCLAVKDEGVKQMVWLEKGMDLHSQVLESCRNLDVLVSNSLMDMYFKCGSLVDARGVFDRMLLHTVVSWNILLLGYAGNCEEELSLELFGRMRNDYGSCQTNSRTYVAALKACASLALREDWMKLDDNRIALLEKGLEIHRQAAGDRCDSDLFVSNTLVDMYAKCGSLENAARVFEGISYRNVVSWNALLLGYAENDEGELTLELFQRMQREGCCQPDALTYVAAFKACTLLASKEEGSSSKSDALETGTRIHKQVSGSRFEADKLVASSMLDFYTRCGCMERAVEVFDQTPSPDLVMWTGLILGYVDNNEAETALEVFGRMKSKAAAVPDSRIYAAALKACTSLASKEEGRLITDDNVVKVIALEKGMDVHFQARKAGFESEQCVNNGLLEMYCKSGIMLEARKIFDRMASHSLASWNSLLLGYAENQQEDLALELFSFMTGPEEICAPDARTFVAALKASAGGKSVDLGTVKEVHGSICRLGLDEETVLATCLLDAYGKSGSPFDAQLVFETIVAKDLVVWNSLLGAYSQAGDAGRVMDGFRKMGQEGVCADGITFVAVLSALSHAGLVEEGKAMFEAMASKYGVIRGAEHYVCMVDLLGRSNELDVAVEMLSTMPFEASRVAWMTLLGACKKWKNVKVGEIAFENLVRIDGRGSAAAYVLLANAYEAAE